ncbi:MAG: hypothetical protein JNJ43_14920 [Anaerolineales bacterium]|nr:hypothetical protein [Anaerolineales bacterium]
MAKFDLSHSKVTNQVVAETINSVNFGTVQNKEDLVVELRELISEINKATKKGLVKKKISTDVKSHIEKAITEVRKPDAKKQPILEHIEGAKSLLDGMTSASNLVTSLITAAKIAGSLFL